MIGATRRPAGMPARRGLARRGRSGTGLARNDPRQYDQLAAAWWAPSGPFAMLSWIAAARASLVPVAPEPGALLVDLACGGGLLAPHLAGKGYRHLGLDLTSSALKQARAHGVVPVQADVLALPLPDRVAAVVCAGEILEHVADLDTAVAEACRVLRPGGLLVLDTLAATRRARLLAVGLAERIPGGAPPGIHDPRLFVDRDALLELAAGHGVTLCLTGLRPSLPGLARWLAGGRLPVAMRPSRSTAVLFQGHGRKDQGHGGKER